MKLELTSSIVLLVLSLAVLGLLLVIASAYDASERIVDSENIQDHSPAIQQKLFEDCIKDQRFDGELTEEEYDRCAYSIYD